MQIRPYGDRSEDGIIQLSFTLPLEVGKVAHEAARLMCLKMGLTSPTVANMTSVGPGFTFFVLYARAEWSLDLHEVNTSDLMEPKLTREEMELLVKQSLGRKIVIVGACTGTDAHTVGLDAILNRKGFHGNFGLESYDFFQVHNLGSQVDNVDLLSQALKLRADAILISQVVTQRDLHLSNLTQMVDLLEAEGQRDTVTLIAGGPRITHQLAIELGYDAGYGAETLPSDVAAFIVSRVVSELHTKSETES